MCDGAQGPPWKLPPLMPPAARGPRGSIAPHVASSCTKLEGSVSTQRRRSLFGPALALARSDQPPLSAARVLPLPSGCLSSCLCRIAPCRRCGGRHAPAGGGWPAPAAAATHRSLPAFDP